MWSMSCEGGDVKLPDESAPTPTTKFRSHGAGHDPPGPEDSPRNTRFVLLNGSPVEREKARADRRSILTELEGALGEMDSVAVLIAEVANMPEAMSAEGGFVWDAVAFEEIRKGYEAGRDLLIEEMATELRKRGLPIDQLRVRG